MDLHRAYRAWEREWSQKFTNDTPQSERETHKYNVMWKKIRPDQKNI